MSVKELLAIGFHSAARDQFGVDVIPAYDAVEAEPHRELARAQADLATMMLGEPGTIGWAIIAMKAGNAVRRRGWNGRGMFLAYMPRLELPPYNTQGTERKVNDRTAKWIGEDQPLDCNPYIAMFTADRKWQPGWLASQTDLLADDWEIAE